MSFYRYKFAVLTTSIVVMMTSLAFGNSKINPIHIASNSVSTTIPASEVNTTKHSVDKQDSENESKININKATEKELIKVRGLNASKARAIVKYRTRHGGFKSLESLAKIRGFTRMREEDLKDIENQLTLQ